MTATIIPFDLEGRQKAARRRARIEAARRVLAWREALGWSQTRAAVEMGVPLRTWRTWEHGRARMPAEILVLCERVGRRAA